MHGFLLQKSQVSVSYLQSILLFDVKDLIFRTVKELELEACNTEIIGKRRKLT